MEEPFRVTSGDGGWTAWCEELGMGGCGKTKEEAIEDLLTTLIVYCKALEKRIPGRK